MVDNKIAVFDVETPNSNHDSICSIGFTIIEDSIVSEQFSFLINPEADFDNACIRVHHITKDDVIDSPTFPDVWDKVKSYFSDYLVAGHNLSFDLSCINKSLHKYNLSALPAYYVDTLEISRNNIFDTENYQLTTLCNMFGIDLVSHHDALQDSTATAELLLKLINDYDVDLNDYLNKYEFEQRKKTTRRKKRHINVSYSETTKSLQELQGILFGVTCDYVLTDDEIYAIKKWCDLHITLRGNFPFDKIYNSIEKVLEDNIITEEERKELFTIFSNILSPVDYNDNIESTDLNNSLVCLSGEFECMSKAELTEILESQGAIVKKNVVKNLNYLIVGDRGNDNWSQGNYGNKVKKAMEFNEKGTSIEIIREQDFIPLIIDE